jgi:DNA-binding NtrC family response regulator
VNVRVIAATNRDLRQCVQEGSFRQDLYYRLSAFPVDIPPLRERKDDIPALASHFLSQLDGADYHLPMCSSVLAALLDHDYPGNVRELKNIVERAAILAGNGPIQPQHLGIERSQAVPQRWPAQPAEWLSQRNRRHDDQAILDALQQADGHRSRAAELLGISERSLYRRLANLRQGD